MIRVYFDGQLECGAFIKNASVVLPEDYTMSQLVAAIKSNGYMSFMAGTMKRLVKI